MTRQHIIAAFSALALIAAAGLLTAGPINPPVGPIASTAKPLSEVEPRTAINAANTPGDATSLFRITQPGSYYLTGNITGVVGKQGIAIAASGVTLDLMGFDLAGVPAMGALDGVSTTVSGLTNIAVLNGSVRNWGDAGVDLTTLPATNCRVEGVHASGNGGSGINAGIASTVSNCSAYSNTFNGIFASTGCTITNCSVYQTTGNGNGITTGTGCTVSNCSAIQNTASGISTGTGCTVSNCSAAFNTGNGISTGLGCAVSNCSASSNILSGISAGSGGTVADCTDRFNAVDGILCNSNCTVRDNTCASNGNGAGTGAGIHVAGNDCRIEGNNCTGADRGIQVDFGSNIIIRNTCSNNGLNWVIAIGNSFGPIVIAATNSVAISGTGPQLSTLTTTDPNANFSY